MAYSDFDLASRTRRSSVARSLVPSVITSEDPSVMDPESVLISDSKGQFDSVAKELPSGDARCAQEVPVIQDQLALHRGRVRWVPHNCNPADALT
eukprot:3377982-Alexandrium_andersonii.AAC.1